MQPITIIQFAVTVGAYVRTNTDAPCMFMRRISSATLELPEDTLVILSFHFLFMRKPTSACPLLASEWYSRWPLWRVVKLSSFLRTSPSPITSHFMLFSFSSSSSSCTCSSFSNVLTLVCCNLQSLSPCVVVLLPHPPPQTQTGTRADTYVSTHEPKRTVAHIHGHTHCVRARSRMHANVRTGTHTRPNACTYARPLIFPHT